MGSAALERKTVVQERSSPLAQSFPVPRRSRSLHFAVFAIGLLWLLASRIGAESAAQGIARLLHAELLTPLLARLFLLILLLTGFTALNWVGIRNGSVRSTNALPWRRTAGREWQKGAALGWALLLVAVLPAALVGALHPLFWFAPRAWGFAALATLTLLLGALATEVAFRGFLFQRLIAAIGPAGATVTMAAIYAYVATSLQSVTPFSFAVSLMVAFVASLAYLRTHGLWLGWGLRFGWLASMGVLFGLPIEGSADVANLVATRSSGPLWMTGGAYGPEGGLVAGVVLLGGLFVLYRLTRDYAWDYTHTPIVAGGYPMDVPPPKAHAAMEAAPPPPALVQILGAVPVTSLLPQRPPPPAIGGMPPPREMPPSPSAGSGDELAPAAEVDEARS